MPTPFSVAHAHTQTHTAIESAVELTSGGHPSSTFSRLAHTAPADAHTDLDTDARAHARANANVETGGSVEADAMAQADETVGVGLAGGGVGVDGPTGRATRPHLNPTHLASAADARPDTLLTATHCNTLQHTLLNASTSDAPFTAQNFTPHTLSRVAARLDARLEAPLPPQPLHLSPPSLDAAVRAHSLDAPLTASTLNGDGRSDSMSLVEQVAVLQQSLGALQARHQALLLREHQSGQGVGAEGQVVVTGEDMEEGVGGAAVGKESAEEGRQESERAERRERQREGGAWVQQEAADGSVNEEAHLKALLLRVQEGEMER